MGVTLAPSSIPKLRQAIADGEAFRMSRGTDRLPAGPESAPFWAFIVGIGTEYPANNNASPSDQRMVYSFVRLAPCADAEADLWLNKTQAYKFTGEGAAIHQAIEINARPTPTNSIVRMSFAGFAEQTEEVDGQQVKVKRPRFAFSHAPTLFERVLPLHDHRDNAHGGFAFATYHPGTGLPQQPWAL
jgi:hypothetical protein